MKHSVCAKSSHFASLRFRAIFAILALLVFMPAFNGTPLYPAALNDTQVIKSDHWVYEAVYTLFTRSGQTCPASSFPITVGELKFLLKQVDSSSFDNVTNHLYNEVYSFLYDDEDLIHRFFSDESASDATDTDSFVFSVTPRLTPEAYVKSNDDVSWFFARQDPYLKDNFATLPVRLGFGNFITLETDIFYGKNRAEARLPENWTNLPLNGRFDYLYPRFAYGSAGIFHENWGASFHIANEGLTIGKTLTGSIIYNRTFETASYAELNLYSNWGSYALDVAQVDYNRFMYLHHLEIRPFKQLKIALIEGGLVNGPMEMKYLNPLMIVHSWYPNQDYQETEAPGSNGGDHKYCAYLGVMLDYVPCRNLRIYALWAQNELQAFGELDNDYGKQLPDSFGLQVGAETFFSGGDNQLWKINLESVYTLPFLYMKQSAQSSLYRARKDDHVDGGAINSWIGTPFGPDCLAIQTGVTCSQTGVWSAGLNYLLTIHGENGFGTFTDSRWAYEVDGVTYYAYYPSVKAIRNLATTEECIAEARNHWLSGLLEYRNDIVLNGSYTLNKYCSFDAQFVYTFVFNSGHTQDNFQQGVELAISATFKYF
ncbi:MAG: hypothetical protein J5747_11445 [Spirochaetaceae bacterium]|nr:hypothetical protein [Spirochaetaceae bacterium]